jgi:hypothetical protein
MWERQISRLRKWRYFSLIHLVKLHNVNVDNEPSEAISEDMKIDMNKIMNKLSAQMDNL